MTYQESQARDEAYRAGREGRSVYTAYGDDYDRGKKERANAKRRWNELTEGSGAGAGPGLVYLFLLAVLVMVALAVMSAAVSAAAGAVVAALPLWFLSRLPPGGANIGYRLAYRASVAALMIWILLTFLVGLGAEWLRTGQPGTWHQWVRDTSDAFRLTAMRVIAAAAAQLPWPDRDVGALGLDPRALTAADGVPELRRVLSMPHVFAVLVLLPLVGATIALKVTLPFGGVIGFVRACIAAPLVVASGAVGIVSVAMGIAWLALHADTPPSLPAVELGVAAAVAAIVLGAAALAGALLGGPLVALVTAAVTLGRRIPVGASVVGMGFAIFVAGLVSAFALYFFRDADAYVAHIAAAVAGGSVWPSSSSLGAFGIVAAPGVLLGALVLRAALREPYRGALGYFAVSAMFAPIAVAIQTAALAAGVVAIELPQIEAWVR
jgi:hypothetical protein